MDLNQVIESSARYISDQMSLSDWLGETLKLNHFNLALISKENIHTILLKTVMLLHDEWDQDDFGDIDIDYTDDSEDEKCYVYDDDDDE